MSDTESKPKISKSESARLNGAKSRGPVTAEGRLNSANGNLKHGAYSRRVLMEGESQEGYDLFRSAFCDFFQPADPFEAECVDAMVSARWRIRRLESMETTTLDHAVIENKPAIDAKFESIDPLHERGVAVHSHLASLDASSRVQERLQRIYDRNYKLLAAHRRKSARAMPSPEPPLQTTETAEAAEPPANPGKESSAATELTNHPNFLLSVAKAVVRLALPVLKIKFARFSIFRRLQ